MWRCLRDPIFSVLVEHRLVTDRQSGGQTDKQTHDDRIYRANIASRGKDDWNRMIIAEFPKCCCCCCSLISAGFKRILLHLAGLGRTDGVGSY